MHGSFRTEKMNPTVSSGGHWVSSKDKSRSNARKRDDSKRKGKSAYSSARKLKESQYVWSE